VFKFYTRRLQIDNAFLCEFDTLYVSIMLDIQALLTFLAVADAGSTHAAARSLHLSQASVSRRLARLEKSLGVALFIRGSHQLRLSNAGARLLPDARAHVNALMHALADARTAGPTGKTTVTVACLATLSLYVLPKILSDFLAANPNVRLRLLDLAPADIDESVTSGAADFALTMLGVGAPNLTHEVLAQDPLVLVCPADHLFASRRSATWSELTDLTLIGIGPHSANQRLLDSARSSIGVHLNWQHEVQRATTAVELVAAGIGLAVLPWGPELEHRPDINFVPLVDPVINRRIGILRRSGEHLVPAAARLRRLIAARLSKRRALANAVFSGVK
jgi:DNA-binding transcriptional LysR family regulator